MNMDINDAIDLINKAYEEKADDRLYQRWIPISSEMSFDDFKDSLIKRRQQINDTRTGTEILLTIKEQMDKGGIIGNI